MGYIVFAVLAIFGDQVVKWYVMNNLDLREVVAFIPGLVQLTYFQNTGVAFGFLQGQPWIPMVLTPVLLIVLVVLMVKGVVSDPAQRWALTAIAAGGAGNLIDRFVHGFVVDMFEFMFVRFAIFNVADIFITLGGVAFVLAYLRAELRLQRERTAESSNE